MPAQTSIDTDTSCQEREKEGDTEPDTTDTSDTSIDTGNNDTDDTVDSASVSANASDTRPVAEKLSKTELISLIESMVLAGLSQTQIISALWAVEKNKAGWKSAYTRFKKLTGE